LATNDQFVTYDTKGLPSSSNCIAPTFLLAESKVGADVRFLSPHSSLSYIWDIGTGEMFLQSNQFTYSDFGKYFSGEGQERSFFGTNNHWCLLLPMCGERCRLGDV
jgi:hypothetical protein